MKRDMGKISRQNPDLKKIIEVAKILGSKQIILFGSQAKRRETQASDLDLCILTRKGENPLKYQKEFRLKLWERGYRWTFPIDLHIYPEDIYQNRLYQKDPFIVEIQKGIVLYG